MRIRFDPTPEQRAALRARLASLLQPEVALALLESSLPVGFRPGAVTCSVQSEHADRFVLRVRIRANAGGACGYALKAYSDDFGERVWTHSQALAEHLPRLRAGRLCLALRYVPEERVLVFPWVDGRFLSTIVDAHTAELLRLAAVMVAELHRLGIVPEQVTTAQQFLDTTRARCDGLASCCPEVADSVTPLLTALQALVPGLDGADPAPIHGDLGAGQFLWTGNQLVLLDWDMFGYADPAYDAGHFQAQLERRCLLDGVLPPHARRWPACFRDAYRAAMPAVSWRNTAFYRALTLARKAYTVCRAGAEGPARAARLVAGAWAALADVTAPRRAA